MPPPHPAREAAPVRTSKPTDMAQSQPRTKGPSASEWARMRPFIEQRYIQEERSQEEVLVLLKEQHGFVARSVLKTQ